MKVSTRTVRIAADERRRQPLHPRVYYRTSSDAERSAAGARTLSRNRIIVGDAQKTLRKLPSASVDCVITSPPYFLLRNYGVEDQLGAETNVDSYVARLLGVCDEIARVLKPTGSFWLNLGDSYSRHARYGAAAKSLLLAPERILLGLAERGWIVRNKLVWAKPNPMPASVRDRLSATWEPLYLLVRSDRYYFDLDAIREPHRTVRTPSRQRPKTKYGGRRAQWAGPLAGVNDGLDRAHAEGRSGHPLGKNPGDVWRVPTAGFRGEHFATFPTRLIERPILAGCPERVCTACGHPWRQSDGELAPSCGCLANWRPGLVLDPFMGAGTVAVATEQRGRDWLGIELNPQFAELARARIEAERAKRNGRLLPEKTGPRGGRTARPSAECQREM